MKKRLIIILVVASMNQLNGKGLSPTKAPRGSYSNEQHILAVSMMEQLEQLIQHDTQRRHTYTMLKQIVNTEINTMLT